MKIVSSVKEFKNIFATYNICNYDCIYISFGSKYNQQTVEYTMQNTSIKKRSNAHWQMLPGFIRNKKSLAICFDRFENDIIKQENIDILKKEIGEETIIICHIDGTIPLFEDIVQFLLAQFTVNSVDPTRVILVNYLRFISPNESELYLEQHLSTTIQHMLTSTIYINCLYEWFGYQPNLYNMIYNYNDHIIYHLLSNSRSIMQKTLVYDELSIYNVSTILAMDPKIASFLKHIYDITLTDTMQPVYSYS